MSVFRVKLTSSRQGQLDIHDNQRSAYITGPNRINRKLKDGETFVDCNYWKRFAYPSVPLEEAFIEVLEDDGTIWSDKATDNTYPKVYDIIAGAGTSFGQNKADVAADSGSYALFAQITNKGTEAVKIRLNGLNTAVLDLDASNTQSFNSGELTIGLIEVENASSESVHVQIVLSIKAVSTS
jgi:hypothetical protein